MKLERRSLADAVTRRLRRRWLVAALATAVVSFAWARAVDPVGVMRRAGAQPEAVMDPSSVVLLLSSVLGVAAIGITVAVLVAALFWGAGRRSEHPGRA